MGTMGDSTDSRTASEAGVGPATVSPHSQDVPHHCAPSDYVAMIARLEAIEAGEVSPRDVDWRTTSGVLARMLRYATAPAAASSKVALLLENLQRREHNRVIYNFRTSPMFSVEHWTHNAGPNWHHEDDDSYTDFDNCLDPGCVLARQLMGALSVVSDV